MFEKSISGSLLQYALKLVNSYKTTPSDYTEDLEFYADVLLQSVNVIILLYILVQVRIIIICCYFK